MYTDNILINEYMKMFNHDNIITQWSIKSIFGKITKYFTCFNSVLSFGQNLSTGNWSGVAQDLVTNGRSVISQVTSTYSFIGGITNKLQNIGNKQLGQAMEGPINVTKNGGDLNAATAKMLNKMKDGFINGVQDSLKGFTTVSESRLIYEDITKLLNSNIYKEKFKYTKIICENTFVDLICESVKSSNQKQSFYYNLNNDLFIITENRNINIIKNNNKLIYEENNLKTNKNIIFESNNLVNAYIASILDDNGNTQYNNNIKNKLKEMVNTATSKNIKKDDIIKRIEHGKISASDITKLQNDPGVKEIYSNNNQKFFNLTKKQISELKLKPDEDTSKFIEQIQQNNKHNEPISVNPSKQQQTRYLVDNAKIKNNPNQVIGIDNENKPKFNKPKLRQADLDAIAKREKDAVKTQIEATAKKTAKEAAAKKAAEEAAKIKVKAAEEAAAKKAAEEAAKIKVKAAKEAAAKKAAEEAAKIKVKAAEEAATKEKFENEQIKAGKVKVQRRKMGR